MRLRALRGAACEALIVNTSGGIVGGDRLSIAIAVEGRGSAVTIGAIAAEKCYRSAEAASTLDIRLRASDGACLHWLPQETILYDGASLCRSVMVELASDAAFVGLETIVFGRIAHGETMATGSLRDSWRLRRGGRLVYADETLLATPIDAKLGRKAVGGGARAMATLLAAGDDLDTRLEPLRAALAPFAAGLSAVESGASLRDGVLVSRMLCVSPERLRLCAIAAMGVLRVAAPPRSWT